MRLKRQLEYQTRHFLHFLQTIELPVALLSPRLKRGLFMAVIVFGIGYVFQMSSLSTSGYVIQDLEKQIAGLNSEQQKLDVAVATGQSMASIQERLPHLRLTPIAKIEHVQLTTQTALAR